MTKIKSKVQLPRLETFEQMEAVFGTLATDTLRREKLQAGLDYKLNQVKLLFQKDHGVEMEQLANAIPGNEKRLHDWAVDNYDAQFKTKRSLETKFGVMKFFKGQHKAECKSKWNWDKVIERIRECQLAKRFIRTIEVPNKEALIEARDQVLKSPAGEFTVADLGVKISQEESFTIEVKREPVNSGTGVPPVQEAA